MKFSRIFFLSFFFFLMPYTSAAERSTPPGKECRFNCIAEEEGLKFGKVTSSVSYGNVSYPVNIDILKINPDLFEFVLFSSKESNISREKIPTLQEWIDKNDLIAAINASMFMEDGETPTAYMRIKNNKINSKISSKYGSFLVCSPRIKNLPNIAILDKNNTPWENILPNYNYVVQNLRLTGQKGEQLWESKQGKSPISAIAQEQDGQILFIHCSDPLSIPDFVEILKVCPNLSIRNAMYTEGGKEACFFVKIRGESYIRTGKSAGSFVYSLLGKNIRLPNVFGLQRKTVFQKKK